MAVKPKNYAFLPEHLIRKDFTFGYKLEDLWKLAAKKRVRYRSVKSVNHWVYRQCWFDKKGDPISIHQVTMNPENYPEIIKKINSIDISLPIIVIEDLNDSKGIILDGNHRFAKLSMIFKPPKIPYIYFSRKELKKYYNLVN